MSEQEGSPQVSVDWAKARVDALLGMIGDAEREIEFCTLNHEARLKALRERLALAVGPYQARRDAYVDELVDLVVKLEQADALNKRSLTLPNGTVAIRDSRPTLVITDEDGLMKALRRLGLLRLTTKQPKRVIVKDWVKKLPMATLAKLQSFAHLQVTTRVTVTPNRTQVELSRDIGPLQRTLPPSA